MKKIYTIALLFLSHWALCQDILVTGTLHDCETSLPVPYCTISLLATKQGTQSTADGTFKLTIKGQVQQKKLLLTCVGYLTDTITVAEGQLAYHVALTPLRGALNEVIVTGVSRATVARENPIPIIGVSAKKIEQAAESNLFDALAKNVPGLNTVKTGPNVSKPFIRGLGYNRVLTLYDGVRQEGQQWGDEHGVEVDAYNVERAEVVKGPASLIYGSDALAGVVGLLPAMPADYDGRIHGKFTSEYQTNNGLIGNGIRLSYANNHWDYILRGSYRMAKNYQNAVDGRVYNSGFRETNATATMRYRSSAGSSSLNLTLYDNLQGVPDGSRDSLTRRFTKQVFEGAADDVTNRPLVIPHELNSYNLSPLHQHIQHYRIYTNNHYQAGKGDIDAQLAFQQNIRREYNHPTLPQQAGMFVRLNTVNYGLSYHAPLLTNTDFTFGVNGMYQNNISKNATDFPIPNYTLFDAGAYAYTKWKHSGWTIGAGIRYDRRTLKGDDFFVGTNAVTGFDKKINVVPAGGTAYLQFPAFDKNFDGVSLSIGSTYRLSKAVSVKANIARGYRAPSITEFASNGLDPGAHIVYLGNRNFKPEFSLQEDIGIEASGKNVSATVSVFNNNIANYIYLSQLVDAAGNSITDAQGNRTFQYQQSKARLYGIEATLSYSPGFIRGLSIDNAFTATHGSNTGAAFRNTGTQGEYLPLIPPLRLLSSVAQQITVNSSRLTSLRFKAEADINAAQNRYLALNNTETFTPAFTLVDLSAGADIKYDKKHTLALQLQVNNVFDLAYQSNLNRLKYFEYYSKSPNGRSGIYNMGRNVCVKVIVPF